MKSTTAERLKQIMKERGLKQVDILELCRPICIKYGVKLNKNDLSQYINAKFIPKQDKLAVLAEALNVTEPWLMGYDDVPKYESPTSLIFDTKVDNNRKITAKELQKGLEDLKSILSNFDSSLIETYAQNEQYILYYYSQLNLLGKKEALKHTIELTRIGEYTNKEK